MAAAVGSLLKPDELPEPLALVRNFERQPVQRLHVGIGLIGQHASALVENPAHAAQHQQIAPLLLPVPCVDEHRTRPDDKPAFQSAPDTGGVRRIGRDLVHALRKKRFRLSGTDQLLRERPHRIGVEQRREQPVERFIITKNQHRIQKRVSCPSFLSGFCRLGAVSRRRTCSGRSSFTPCPVVSSRQRTKYCACFITTPICRSDCMVSVR